MEQRLLAYGFPPPRKYVAVIIMLYTNTKVKICSPDGDIIAGLLQVDTSAPYQFIICLDYMLRTSIDLMKENGFKLAKERSRRYPAQIITDADHADDKAFLGNTPAQAESLQHSLERAAGGIGLRVNADKTEYMCFNQRGDISTLNDEPLKLVDKFNNLGSCVSLTETDINMRLAKVGTALDRLLVIRKSNLTDKKNAVFPKQRSC